MAATRAAAHRQVKPSSGGLLIPQTEGAEAAQSIVRDVQTSLLVLAAFGTALVAYGICA